MSLLLYQTSDITHLTFNAEFQVKLMLKNCGLFSVTLPCTGLRDHQKGGLFIGMFELEFNMFSRLHRNNGTLFVGYQRNVAAVPQPV